MNKLLLKITYISLLAGFLFAPLITQADGMEGLGWIMLIMTAGEIIIRGGIIFIILALLSFLICYYLKKYQKLSLKSDFVSSIILSLLFTYLIFFSKFFYFFDFYSNSLFVYLIFFIIFAIGFINSLIFIKIKKSTAIFYHILLIISFVPIISMASFFIMFEFLKFMNLLLVKIFW